MSAADRAETLQYLTFQLDEELFALDVSKVREILEVDTITRVPQVPGFMRGVINLRGSVVPVIDLKLKFGLAETQSTINTCIIVVEVQLDGTTTVLGALSDSVQEVVEMEPGEIEPSPRIGSRVNTEFIKGMAKSEGKFVMILDIDKVFAGDDLTVS